mmetsp:Transcript_4272/g.8385  ORF Transcript_4272/g.8385 Transcript_4272/m.8385 type:complete len:259 (+) Transcript_4272:1087-1863(+)
MATAWDALRREARRLEGEVDAKLVAYSKLGLAFSGTSQAQTLSSTASNVGDPAVSATTTTTRITSSTDEAAATTAGAAEVMAIEIEQLLVRLSETVDAMGRTLQASQTQPAPSMHHILERHNDILADYKNEFRKTKGSILTAKEHQDLLSSVRQDMIKRGLVPSGASNGDLYTERSAITGANTGAEAALGQGISLREELERQRAMFASMVDRMEAVGDSVPSITRLIGQIRRKRKRDVYVFAAVLAILTLITLFWKVL